MVLWENSKNGTLAFEYIAVRDQLNAKENEITELKRQVEELMAFNETCLQNNKSLTAAKEKEMEDWKTIANVYKQRNNKLIEP
jgi:hypothetical protein